MGSQLCQFDAADAWDRVLLVGVQLSRRIRGSEESEQFLCGLDAVRCVMLYFLPDVINDLPLSVSKKSFRLAEQVFRTL